jgi:hypothetical protein
LPVGAAGLAFGVVVGALMAGGVIVGGVMVGATGFTSVVVVEVLVALTSPSGFFSVVVVVVVVEVPDAVAAGVPEAFAALPEPLAPSFLQPVKVKQARTARNANFFIVRILLVKMCGAASRTFVSRSGRERAAATGSRSTTLAARPAKNRGDDNTGIWNLKYCHTAAQFRFEFVRATRHDLGRIQNPVAPTYKSRQPLSLFQLRKSEPD